MKKTLILFVFALIFSCNRNENYTGIWILDESTITSFIDTPIRLIYTQDSLEIERYDFNPTLKYALHPNRQILIIENDTINTSIIDDTLKVNNRLKYYRDNGTMSNQMGLNFSKIEINLPKINDEKLINYPKIRPSTSIRYGKRYDNRNLSLQLNDKYVDINSLKEFVIDRKEESEGYNNRQKHFLYIDKSSKMKALEKIFLTMASVNEYNVLFVNDSKLQTRDSLAFSFKESLFGTRISHLENWNYFNTITSFDDTIPIVKDYQDYQFYGKINHYPNIISLVRNRFYFNGKEINKVELPLLLNKDIENNNNIFSFYDLESDYYHFLELQIAIRSTYNSVRQKKALKRYNSILNNLTKEQLDSIKSETPIKHIWSYSIPHFKSIIKDNYGFYGMQFKPLDYIFPKTQLN
ncbi:hypothetical protein [Lacinutrix sp. Bg11-31]|uniref:hypothetical protein n=1 Tax=Lacinutrix sp. Bg11-31 TaxID=2057808 RepID=UPI000C304899|nr:hypothetical protein [Lacinutrix sp. Bg11-31]AUC82891.1 hypothetical protein CW733_12460 [Lacinutrix sp. Bg11-31]